MKRGGELSRASGVWRTESDAEASAAGVTTCATAVEGGSVGAADACGGTMRVSGCAIDVSVAQQAMARCIVVTGAVMQHPVAHGTTAPAVKATMAARARIDALSRGIVRVGFC